jgi:hypothetical protein
MCNLGQIRCNRVYVYVSQNSKLDGFMTCRFYLYLLTINTYLYGYIAGKQQLESMPGFVQGVTENMVHMLNCQKLSRMLVIKTY